MDWPLNVFMNDFLSNDFERKICVCKSKIYSVHINLKFKWQKLGDVKKLYIFTTFYDTKNDEHNFYFTKKTYFQIVTTGFL